MRRLSPNRRRAHKRLYCPITNEDRAYRAGRCAICFGNEQTTQLQNTNQNTTQNTASNTNQNTTQNTASNTNQNTAQNSASNTNQNTVQNTAQNSASNTNQNTAQNSASNTNQATNQSQNQNTEQTTSGPDWLTNAAEQNVNSAADLAARGFTPYTGEQVADFSPQQQASFGLADQLTGGISPYATQAGQLAYNASTGPVNTVASQMSPYMNAYVAQALAPQIAAQNQQFQSQNKALDAAATSSGAYGDARAGIEAANLSLNQDIARQGLIGNAYTQAFNTAIGAGAQDVANQQNALARQLSGAGQLYGMGSSGVNLTNQMGQQQTQQSQARLNVPYNQWQLAQQYPFLTSQNLNSALAAGRAAGPVTTTGSLTGLTTGASTGSTTGSMTGASTGSTTGSMTGATTGSTTGSMTGATTGSTVGSTTGASTGSTTADSTGSAYGTGNNIGVTQAPNNAGYGLLGSLGGAALMALADGGYPPVGKPTLVGERGPELFVPNSSGVVIPNEVLEAARVLRARKTAQPASGLALQLGVAA